MLHRALIPTLFVLGTILTGLDSMKCYSCHGSGDSQCADNSTTAAVVQTCYSFENKETDKSAWQRLRPSKDQDNDVGKLEAREVYSVDVKVVCSYFRQKASHMYGEVVVRGCQYIFNNRDFCEEMHKAYESLLGCSVCDTELCNYCIVRLYGDFTGANALSCYSCHGSYESDCAKNSTTSATVQKCYTPKGRIDKDNWQYFGANNIQNPDKNTLDEGNRPNLVATCGYIKWKDNPVMGDMVARGCRYTLHGKGFCERVEKRFKTVVNCQTCTSDLCNA